MLHPREDSFCVEQKFLIQSVQIDINHAIEKDRQSLRVRTGAYFLDLTDVCQMTYICN